jgi:valyl-tRNA synthetase
MVASMQDLTACDKCGGEVRQDEDVLDTWFSSQLWPFATFGWPEPSEKLDYFYPTSVLSTARDILFLWVARMVMSGMYFMDGKVPFEDVIIHPTVFNAEGRRMSKSLGTGVDPLDLMEHYGADGMRFGLMLQVTGNQDIKFSEDKLVSSRNFANKIWNASRFVLMNLEGYEPGEPVAATVADRWILSRLAGLSVRVSEGLDAYEFGEVSRELYDFFWNEFCDWYIELAKARLAAGGETRLAVQRTLVFVLDRALRLLHPMMPFVTEAIWQRLPLPEAERTESLMVAAWPTPADLAGYRDEAAERSMTAMQEIIVAVRAVRARFAVKPTAKVDVLVRADGSDAMLVEAEAHYLRELAGAGTVVVAPDLVRPRHASVEVVLGMEIYVPLEGLVDFDAERARVSKDLVNATEELARLTKKLGNEGFLAKAAQEIVEKDRARAAAIGVDVAKLTAHLAELAE